MIDPQHREKVDAIVARKDLTDNQRLHLYMDLLSTEMRDDPALTLAMDKFKERVDSYGK